MYMYKYIYMYMYIYVYIYIHTHMHWSALEDNLFKLLVDVKCFFKVLCVFTSQICHHMVEISGISLTEPPLRGCDVK